MFQVYFKDFNFSQAVVKVAWVLIMAAAHSMCLHMSVQSSNLQIATGLMCLSGLI
jgi:hypothetical protein